MKMETQIVHAGQANKDYMGVVNLPPHRASTVIFDTLADFEKADNGQWPLPSYGRYGNPSTLALEDIIAKLDDADHSIVFSSGLAAIVNVIMTYCKSGDNLLMVDTTYGCTRRFCDQVLTGMGVEVTYYDPLIGADIEKLIKPNTKMVFCESPGSLSFEMQDIPAIADAAHKKGVLVVADCTWASPLYCKPFELGVDIIMHSATKYMSGHSDVVMGVLSCKEEHYKAIHTTFKNMGPAPAADNCYLITRGLRTMALRMEKQMENAITIAKWLQARPEVERVLYPMLEDDPGHALWKRDMTGGASLFGTLLKPCSHEGLAAMLDGLEHYGMGYSWGGFESLVITYDAHRVRTATNWEHQGPNLRFHIGLEHVDDLIDDLDKGFDRLKQHG